MKKSKVFTQIFIFVVMFLIAMILGNSYFSHAADKQKWRSDIKRDLQLVLSRTINGQAGIRQHSWLFDKMLYSTTVTYNPYSNGCEDLRLLIYWVSKDNKPKDLASLLSKFFIDKNPPSILLDHLQIFEDSDCDGVVERSTIFWKSDGAPFFEIEKNGGDALGMKSQEKIDHFYGTKSGKLMQDDFRSFIGTIAEFIRDSEKPR